MAGNVWEWLRNEHAIGGVSRKKDFFLTIKGRTWKLLKDPIPDESLYRKNKVDQATYSDYHIKKDSLERVGIRCVIEL